MAEHVHSIVLISLFFVALSFNVAFSSPRRDYPGLKSLHFTLYEQDTINRTTFLIVKGVETGGIRSPFSAPFGSLYAFHDPLTILPNSSSKVVGTMEGIGVVSTLDGLQTINVMKMTLNLSKHKGSITVVGAVPNVVPGDLTVVGGTGDFMFVQGYVTVSPSQFSFPSITYKNEFHLYWPPYATF